MKTFHVFKFLLRNRYASIPHCKTDKIVEVSNGRFRLTRNINLTCARKDIQNYEDYFANDFKLRMLISNLWELLLHIYVLSIPKFFFQAFFRWNNMMLKFIKQILWGWNSKPIIHFFQLATSCHVQMTSAHISTLRALTKMNFCYDYFKCIAYCIVISKKSTEMTFLTYCVYFENNDILNYKAWYESSQGHNREGMHNTSISKWQG